MKKLRVRFAPSPTGQVHIGNIRAAIFNWLYARNQNGEFLLRIEDTDRERSTKSAVDALLDVMDWLGLEYDGEILYQSTRIDTHLAAAEKLRQGGSAFKKESGVSGGQPIIFLLPYDCANINFVRTKENISVQNPAGKEIIIRRSGASFYCIENGRETERECSLAGLYKLKIFDSENKIIFDLDSKISSISQGDELIIQNAAKMEFIRREVFFNDKVKGELSKPLDSMKDFVIVRSDNTPVFHLANVCDDIAQEVNFIIRGDDHVENTFRHLFLFDALKYQPPQYAHLPMIVNQSGKPYSKRDGDAYVGDFKSKGFLPQALFNYLALLGWSPGDDREKMTKEEMIKNFSLNRVKSSPAQFDIQKLINMNGLYISEMTPDDFICASYGFLNWNEGKPPIEDFAKIAALMQSRTKTLAQAAEWKYLFYDSYEINPKDMEKAFSNPQTRDAMLSLADNFANFASLEAENITELIGKTEENFCLKRGSLNFPLRIVLSGSKSGPPIDDIIIALGTKKISDRIKNKIV